MINFSSIPSLPIMAFEADDAGDQLTSKARKAGRWKPIRKMFWVHIEPDSTADSKRIDGLL